MVISLQFALEKYQDKHQFRFKLIYTCKGTSSVGLFLYIKRLFCLQEIQGTISELLVILLICILTDPKMYLLVATPVRRNERGDFGLSFT